MRSLISVLAVAIEVIMMLTIIAIMVGQLTGQKRMNNGIGADLIVRPSNAMVFNGISGAAIPVKLAGDSAGAAACRRGHPGESQALHDRWIGGAVGNRIPDLQPTEPIRLYIGRAAAEAGRCHRG